ncbi:MAG: hypothetical protein HC810_08885 [Acaryochloridaceae cyanobacterium RL_2_7]|nr:hypothetical protein [Acaryochloridaceae cyanobacterium RL_2_7]
MPSTTIDKLNRLKAQLEQCNNQTAALLLKRTIAKLESQLQIEQLTTLSAKATGKEAPITLQANTQHQFPAQNQVEEKPKAAPQQRTAQPSAAKSKPREHPPEKQPLLSGNGTHQGWCRIPGIIRMQEPAAKGDKSLYFLEVDGLRIKLILNRYSFNRINEILDQPSMVYGYPQIIDGQILSLKFRGIPKQGTDLPEDWSMIGVWRADKQRILIQRDQSRDPEIRIRQHSPLVHEDCLEKLEGGKLYRFMCKREGITVTVVGVEAIVSEEKHPNQTLP